MSTLFLFLLCLLGLVSQSLSMLTCHNYQSTHNATMQHTWTSCDPSVQFCMKHRQETRDVTGKVTYYEVRNCGTSGFCQRNGCRSDGVERVCCCSENLCNSSEIGKLSILPILLIVLAVFRA